MDTLNPVVDGLETFRIKIKQMVPTLFASQKRERERERMERERKKKEREKSKKERKFFYQLKCVSGNLIRMIVGALWWSDI